MTREDRLQALRARLDAHTYDASDAPTNGALLSNHVSRTGTTVHGWRAVLFGSLIVAVGFGVAAQALEIVEPGTSTPAHGTKSWAVTIIGATFTLVGLWLTVHGLRGVRRLARVRALRPVHPDEPWRWDHAWDERVARDDSAARARHFFVVGMFLLVFFTPFYWFTVFGPRLALPFGLIPLLFQAFAVGILVTAGYLVAQRMKYGRGVARLAQFPFRRGGRLELNVEAPRALPRHAAVSAVLRCVQERYVTRRRHGESSTTVECFEIYRDAGRAELVGAGSGRPALRVSFDIPADAPTTDLASRPCRYWEVDLGAVTDGVDYAARFLVPVY